MREEEPDEIPWEDLHKRTLAGDSVAKAQLSVEMSRVLNRWLRHICRWPDVAQELSQETILKALDGDLAWLRGWSPRKGRRFPSYLWIKMTWVYRDWLRSDDGRTRSSFLNLDFLDDILPSQASLHDPDVKAAALDELASLRSDYRDAIWGFHCCGIDQQELAVREEVSPNVIAIRVSRGLAELRAGLKLRLSRQTSEIIRRTDP